VQEVFARAIEGKRQHGRLTEGQRVEEVSVAPTDDFTKRVMPAKQHGSLRRYRSKTLWYRYRTKFKTIAHILPTIVLAFTFATNGFKYYRCYEA